MNWMALSRFDNYRGPCWPATDLFPIPSIARYFTMNGQSCSRTQFPVTLAWAVTIHKSQGLTMDRVVVDIGAKEQTTGLTYVALTRVRSFDGIVFGTTFDLPRLQKLGKSTIHYRIAIETKLKSLAMQIAPNGTSLLPVLPQPQVVDVDEVALLNASFSSSMALAGWFAPKYACYAVSQFDCASDANNDALAMDEDAEDSTCRGILAERSLSNINHIFSYGVTDVLIHPF